MERREDLLQDYSYANGVRFVLYDRSCRVAGDRWQVRIEAELRLARGALAELCGRLGRQTSELPADWDAAGGVLGRIIRRERQFVADDQREQVRTEEVGGLLAHLGEYLARPSLPEKLVLAVLAEESRRRLAVAGAGNSFGHLDDDAGPADFSALFAAD